LCRGIPVLSIQLGTLNVMSVVVTFHFTFQSSHAGTKVANSKIRLQSLLRWDFFFQSQKHTSRQFHCIPDDKYHAQSNNGPYKGIHEAMQSIARLQGTGIDPYHKVSLFQGGTGRRCEGSGRMVVGSDVFLFSCCCC
jgi:hypothetical protein